MIYFNDVTADMEKYIGNWKNGLQHGSGTMTYRNGDRCAGN